MESTPRANRVHIGIYGKCNSGKSSLINAITGQQTAVVSELPGTTTDPVNKSMEVPGLGAVTFIDTAGFDDDSELGERRLEQTRKAADRTDIALVVYGTGDSETEDAWVRMFGQRNVPVVAVLNKIDTIENREEFIERMRRRTGMEPVAVSARTGEGIDKLIRRLGELGRGAADEATITGDLVTEGDVVMLIMPQDAQAPKGRLILPQVQTIRELLDKRCIVVSCTPDTMEGALRALSAAPKLVITDSQAFGVVSRITPAESLLTSFSVLFAHYKGDIDSFVAGSASHRPPHRTVARADCRGVHACAGHGRHRPRKDSQSAAQAGWRRVADRRGGRHRLSGGSDPLRSGDPLRSLHVQPAPRAVAAGESRGAGRADDQLRGHDRPPDGHPRPRGLSEGPRIGFRTVFRTASTCAVLPYRL